MIRLKTTNLTQISILIFLISLSASVQAGKREKIDKVIMHNGDFVTCEIKKLEYGLLIVKTADMGTLDIKWDKIARLQSTYIFEIEMVDGEIYYGKFGEPSEDGKLSIVSGPSIKEYDMMNAVAITQIDNRFWSRLDGSVGAGVNLSSANQLFQLTTNFNTTYRARKYHGTITYAGNYTIQEERDPVTRQDLALLFLKSLEQKWFYMGYTGAQTNSELGLKLRLSLGGGPGKAFIQSNRNLLGALVGLVANREWSLDSTGSISNNLEGLLGLRFNRFKYDTPKSNISSSVSFLPGLIPWGRYRVEISLDFSQEIVRDFTIGLNGYLSYDSQPITIGASQLDYGLNLVVGYTW